MLTLQRTHVQKLQPSQEIPSELRDLLGGLTPDPEWTLAYSEDDEIKGLLLVSPVHGMLFLVRLAMAEKASNKGVLLLLRAASELGRQHGLTLFLTYTSESPAEQKLKRIAQKLGAISVKVTGEWVCGRLPERI